MVLGGALKPLLEMAKSGDATCENESLMALANLALSEDNQKQFMKEGGMAVIEVMTLSRNPRVQHMVRGRAEGVEGADEGKFFFFFFSYCKCSQIRYSTFISFSALHTDRLARLFHYVTRTLCTAFNASRGEFIVWVSGSVRPLHRRGRVKEGSGVVFCLF